MSANARHSKAAIRWGTPPEYVAMSRVALGGHVELDPMSEPAFNEIVQAERIYTAEDDCFRHTWRCSTMLINPAGGLVVEAWRKLCSEYVAGHVRRAVWIGFSVEQLNLLADEPTHPDDFSKLTVRGRIDFLTPHPMREVTHRMSSPKILSLACGHSVPWKSKKHDADNLRCPECTGTPEPNGSPSHGNYVVGLGIDRDVFEQAFAGRGRFHHGRLAVMKRKPKDDRVHPPDAYCRSCIRDCGGQPYREAAIGKDDAVVPICVSCSDEPVVERDNLFGGGRGGIGDGNRRTGSRR